MNKIIISVFLSGVFFGAGPCLASCGPIIISYVAGTKNNITKSLIAYALFSLARISVYVVFSIFIFFLGSFTLERILGNSYEFILMIGGAFILFVGALMFFGKRLEFKAYNSLRRNVIERDKKSIIFFGLITGLLPCAPLLAVLSYIGLVSTAWAHSLLYSLFFGLGTLLSPLILLTILSGLLGQNLSNKKYYQIFSSICGLIIMFLGLQLIRKAF